ncbi:MAG: hypothetical protein BWY78_00560 [Alphaproteobacteria bacterium ADurb.Bin438]|nr:MAG: hypothetical protein BWY78_00560 [Alphaproteobacteria bacterium ADurb.Bin438]
MSLYEEISNFVPYDENEEASKQSFLQFIDGFKDKNNLYLRDNLIGHISSSAFVINKARTKVLMAYHNIYQSFGWLGGHADGDENLLYVALKETGEESGVKNHRPLSKNFSDIAVLHVVPHVKRGKFVPAHLHFNVTYFIEADEDEALQIAEGENSALKWLEFKNVAKNVKEEHMVPIYERLIQKIKNI